jgi:hypothetical protein
MGLFSIADWGLRIYDGRHTECAYYVGLRFVEKSGHSSSKFFVSTEICQKGWGVQGL